MARKIFILILGCIVLAGGAWATYPTPQRGTLPFYYVIGTITNPELLNGRKILLHSSNWNDGKCVSADVVNGKFILNLGELYYYNSDTLSFPKETFTETAANNAFFLSIVRTDQTNYGAVEPFLVDWSKGYTEKTLTLTDGGGFKQGTGAIIGFVRDGQSKLGIAEAQISCSDPLLNQLSNAGGAFASLEVLPKTGAVLNCSKTNYSSSSLTVSILANTITSVTFDLASSAGLPGAIVPLTITASGNDIKLAWDKTAFPKPAIFMLTGTGIGTYSNAYEIAADKWLPIITQSLVGLFDMSNYDNGYVLYLGQIGSGAKEAYFKAVDSTKFQSESDPLLPPTFAAAPAVGKFNLDATRNVTTGWNFISYPFKSASLNSVAFGQLATGDELWVWNNETKKFTKIIKYSATSGWPQGETLDRTKGYLLYRSATQPATMTVLGEVDLSSAAVTLSRTSTTGWNFIGNPFPAQKTVGNLNLGGALNADEIWIYSNVTKKFNKIVKKASWNDELLLSGKSYLYYRSNTPSFDWQINWQ